jgi:hypothetical protein
MLSCTLLVHVLLFGLSGGAEAAISGQASASVLSHGVYSQRKASGVDDGESRCPGHGMVLDTATRYVPGELLTRFGFLFAIQPDTETEGGPATVLVRVHHPVLHDPVKGEGSTTHSWFQRVCINEPAYAGWEFTSPWEIEPGAWRVEVYYKGERVAAREFQVLAGSLPSAVNKRYSLDQADAASVEGAHAPAGEQGAEHAAAVLVGSFRERGRAEAMADSLKKQGYPVYLHSLADGNGTVWHGVRLGRYANTWRAHEAAEEYRSRERAPAKVIPGALPRPGGERQGATQDNGDQ